MNTISRIVAGVPVILLLASCGMFGGDERPVYQGAEYYKNLEVPPDLTEPDTGSELQVQKPTDQALQLFRENNQLETVVTPVFDGVRMVSSAGESWLEVDNDVEFVWSRLLEFWQSEGIELVEIRPLLGFMETAWTERMDADAGFFKSMFQKLEPDQKDKFRVRVETFDDNRKTRIFIAHTRIERVVCGEYADEYIWRTVSGNQQGNLEAEREIISRMALFAGQSRQNTLQLLENYRPYSSLVRVDSADNTALTMKGDMDFVWRRARRALDRMSMQDIVEHRASGQIDFVVTKISVGQQEEEDELAQTSWLMQLFTGDNEADLAEDESRHYRLLFTALEGQIRIQVLDAADTLTTDEEGHVSGTALAEQLRNILVEKLE